MIPLELQQYAQWVCWRYEREQSGNLTKVPYHPTSGIKADVTNSATWADYHTTQVALSTGAFSGIGFVLTINDPYTFIDLDNPEGVPEIIERHGKVLTMMDSYSEWSPSGKGMHIIVKGRVPSGARRKKIEVYSSVRVMTMTGNTFLNKPIIDRSDILPAFYADLGKVDTVSVVVDEPEKDCDYVIYERMMNAANGDQVLAVWTGESHGLTGDGSHSAGDQALINYLQFYTHNSQQITRMFLASPRAYRLVSGEKKKYAKYIPEMIRKSYDRELPEVDFQALRNITFEPMVAPSVEEFKNPPILEFVSPAPKKYDITFPPGVLGDIAKYIYAQAPLPVKEIAMAGALGVLAGICGRAYNVSDQGVNLYILMIAGTGVGKEAMANGIDKLMDAVEKIVPAAINFRGPGEIASGPALTKFMGKDSPSCFSILGEFGLRLHEMCQDRAQSHMVGLRRILLEIFHKSGKGGSLRPHIYSDKEKNTDVLYSPAFTIIGESTPETFYGHLDESMLTDGLLPRFLVLEYSGERAHLSRTFQGADIPPELVTKLAELSTFCIQMHHSNRVLITQFDAEAKELYWQLSHTYTDHINSNKDNQIAVQLYNRAHLKIMKLAALIAIGVNPIAPTITVEYIRWGQRIVDTDNQNILHRFEMGKVGRETGELNQVGIVTKCIQDYLNDGYNTTLEKYKISPLMHASKIIPLQLIMRKCGMRSGFKLDRLGATNAIMRAMQTLVYDGAIREVKAHQVQIEFGTTMRAYAIVDPKQFS